MTAPHPQLLAQPSKATRQELARAAAIHEGRVSVDDYVRPFIETDIPLDLPGALPGERVQYREVGRGAHRAFGELVSILEPHPYRTVPQCPIVSTCGSCDAMHLDLSFQRHIKQQRLVELLGPLGVRPFDLVPSPRSTHYRRRATFTFREKSGVLGLGVYQKGSHQFVAVPECIVTDPVLIKVRNELLKRLQQELLVSYDEETHAGILRHLILQSSADCCAVLALVVVTQAEKSTWYEIAQRCIAECEAVKNGGLSISVHPEPGNRLLGTSCQLVAGYGTIPMRLGDLRFDIPSGVFTQVNQEVASLVYQTVREWIGPDPGGVLDLFCGVGALGLQVAPSASWGRGIEVSSEAISVARKVAQREGFCHWEFLTGDTVQVLKELRLPEHPSTIIVNPPRRGLEPRLVNQLAAFMPKRMFYVSCNPVSLVRDLKQLCSSGYIVRRAQGFDMFPHTHHVETLVELAT